MIFAFEVCCDVMDSQGDILDALLLSNPFGTVLGPGALQLVLRVVSWIRLVGVSLSRLHNRPLCLARISTDTRDPSISTASGRAELMKGHG